MHKKNEISGIGIYWESASSKGRLDHLVLILKLLTHIPYTLYLQTCARLDKNNYLKSKG